MGFGRLVLASNDFDTSRPEVAGIRAYVGERFPLKGQDQRRPKLESTTFKCLMNYVNAVVVLAKAISCLSLSLGLRIGQQFSF